MTDTYMTRPLPDALSGLTRSLLVYVVVGVVGSFALTAVEVATKQQGAPPATKEPDNSPVDKSVPTSSGLYVVQETSTKKCTIVERKPSTTATVVVADGVYKTRQEAETATKSVKVCTTD